MLTICPFGEQGCRNDESAHLPPTWPGPGAMWVEFVLVLALLRGFFSGFSGFPPSTKTNISKFEFQQDRGPAGKLVKTNVDCKTVVFGSFRKARSLRVKRASLTRP